MIQATPQTRILVAVETVDFRCGIDGLARLCKQQLKSDPFSGTLYVFREFSANLCNGGRVSLAGTGPHGPQRGCLTYLARR